MFETIGKGFKSAVEFVRKADLGQIGKMVAASTMLLGSVALAVAARPHSAEEETVIYDGGSQEEFASEENNDPEN